MEKTVFDIVVAGGGPAGIMAALHAARDGRSVCLIDRKKNIGAPVRCGEGIGLKGFTKYNSVRPEWIKSTIMKITLVAPDKTAVSLPAGSGAYVIDRELMERDLTDDAVKAGASFLRDTTVVKAMRTAEGMYECTTTRGTFACRCLVLADGVESNLAKGFGWNTTLSLHNLHTCAFARITGNRVQQDTCVFYLGRELAPAGYAWVFPRGDCCANVGLGINGTFSTAGKARELLLGFIRQNFPGARCTDLHCGGVPMASWLRPLVKDGVMVVGDSARQMNCSTGAGINYALYAGRLAGTIVAQSFDAGKCRYGHLKLYEKEWARHYGKQQVRSYALKEAMLKFSDNFYNKIAASISGKDINTLNVLKLFLAAFSKHPLLMFKAFRLFGA
jgi:geranylgeranyl reductase family